MHGALKRERAAGQPAPWRSALHAAAVLQGAHVNVGDEMPRMVWQSRPDCSRDPALVTHLPILQVPVWLSSLVPQSVHQHASGSVAHAAAGVAAGAGAGGKQRLRWTPDLHARFTEAVRQLGENTRGL